MHRIGLAGLGGIHWAHTSGIEGLGERARITAIADVSQAMIDRFREQHPNCKPKAFRDYKEMFASGEIDIAGIILPHHLHHAAAMAALEAGLHVFLEKPMCVSTRECDEVIALAERKQLMVMVGHTHQYRDTLIKATELLREGAIGDLRLIETQIVSGGSWNPERGWRMDAKRSGGGVLFDTTPHQMDHLIFFARSRISRVSAFLSSNRLPGENYSDLCATVRFKNGVCGLLSTFAGFKVEDPDYMPIRLIGTKGAMKFTFVGDAVALSKGDTFEMVPCKTGIHPMTQEWKEMFDALDQGRPPRTDGRYGREVVRLAELMIASQREGREIAAA